MSLPARDKENGNRLQKFLEMLAFRLTARNPPTAQGELGLDSISSQWACPFIGAGSWVAIPFGSEKRT